MDRIVLITGGTSGIGKSATEMFEEQGDIVITISRHEVDRHNHYVVDVSDEKSVIECINKIKSQFGHIDILFNNAGYGISGVTELLNSSDVQKLMDVNFMGAFYFIKHSLMLLPKGSKIINTSSAMALFPLPFRGIYASSKSALLTLSLSLNMELSPLGVEVIAICPGDVKTNFTKNRVKDFTTNERYGNRIKTATLGIDSKEDKRMSAETVAKSIIKIANKKKNKPMIIIGWKYKLLYFFSQRLPKSLYLKICKKYFNGIKD